MLSVLFSLSDDPKNEKSEKPDFSEVPPVRAELRFFSESTGCFRNEIVIDFIRTERLHLYRTDPWVGKSERKREGEKYGRRKQR